MLKTWKGFWELRKRYILSSVPIAPFGLTLFWQTCDWILSGMKGSWWDAAFKSTEVLIGIVFSSVWFLATLIYYVQHLEALKRLPELERELEKLEREIEDELDKLKCKLDKVEMTGIEATQAAVGFIERSFGLQVMMDLHEKHPRSTIEALQAVGFNFRNWENHLTKKQDNKVVLIDDDKKIAVWLRYMRTYYFEEAFDIRRKELVTNGRNFCFLLLATFQAFLEQLGENEKLHYYAVTPVHPKDWYNWPHGHMKVRAYFEEDFIGLFYRTLREMLKSPRAQGKVVHGRYILTALDDTVEQPFGWALDGFYTVKQHLNDTWMLPVAVPIGVGGLESANCEVLRAFHTYFAWLNSPDRFPAYDGERLVVPMFCKSWKWDKVRKALEEENYLNRNNVNNALKTLESYFEADSQKSGELQELVKIAEEFHKSKLNNLTNIEPSGCHRCAEVYDKVKSHIQTIINGKNPDFIELLHDFHHYDVLLSEHDEREKQENLRLLLYAVLRLRDCQLIPNPSDNNQWLTLGQVFTETLHSSPDRCFRVGLRSEDMKEWYQSRVKPEFSFFGVERGDECGGRKIDWKLILATDLDYPFEVAKIRIIEPGDDEWSKYYDKITKLIQKEFIVYEAYQRGSNK